MNSKKEMEAVEFGTDDFWDLADAWWTRAMQHREEFGSAEKTPSPMVGEADVERAEARFRESLLREELRELAGLGVPGLLRYLYTAELNSAEFVGLDLEPLRPDWRGYCVPVGNQRAMNVGFQITKPVSRRAGGEVEHATCQPTVDEVAQAIQVLMGWLVRNETIPGMEFGALSPDESELR
jgi:hypothetical protein